MTIKKEISLKDFEFWGGAAVTVSLLRDDELDAIEAWLEDLDVELTETELNDFIWFDLENVIEDILGISMDELYDRKK